MIESRDPVDRRDEALLDLLPESSRQAYDMYGLVRAGRRRRHVAGPQAQVRALDDHVPRAQSAGRACGIVANNPRHLGGILDNDAADKAARFVQLCDAFNIPLVFLDRRTRLHGGQRRWSTRASSGTAQRCCTRWRRRRYPSSPSSCSKGYGAGYFVMAGRAYEPDLLVAWPGAEISVMGAEGMVGIAGKKLFGGETPTPEAKQQLTEQIAAYIDIYKTAGWGHIDDVIDPRDTRKLLAMGLRFTEKRKVERPWRKHGIMPV